MAEGRSPPSTGGGTRLPIFRMSRLAEHGAFPMISSIVRGKFPEWDCIFYGFDNNRRYFHKN
nr:hypothetical protein [Bacillota bacterium]